MPLVGQSGILFFFLENHIPFLAEDLGDDLYVFYYQYTLRESAIFYVTASDISVYFHLRVEIF